LTNRSWPQLFDAAIDAFSANVHHTSAMAVYSSSQAESSMLAKP
jgi:hypothetical protein